jgi:hypothetical protein
LSLAIKGLWFALLLALLLLVAVNPGHAAAILDASWNAPMMNTDGSALTDLASYRVYYDVSSAPCPGSSFVSVASPTQIPQSGDTVVTRLSGLSPGTQYYVAVTAINLKGHESACSHVTSAVAGMAFGVTPTTSANFGNVDVGGTTTQLFTVKNTRGGTVNGAASVGAPFSVVSGSPFSLMGLGATATIVVGFNPTSPGVTTTNLNFTGGGETISRVVSGTAAGTTAGTTAGTAAGTTATASPTTMVPPPPAPVLNSITPSSVSEGQSLTLHISGQYFRPASVVQVNGNARATTFQSSTSLTATIPPTDLMSPGFVAITVATVAPCVGAGANPCESAVQPLAVLERTPATQ